MSLFAPLPNATQGPGGRPLADRMRPRSLDEFVGQEHILAPGKPLRLQIERDDPGSIIFWGPPGVGKTTLAKIIANVTKADFIQFSAVLAGIKEIKQVMADAQKAREMGTRTIIFVDEIHRFNKAQQDAFLPYVENGSIRLIISSLRGERQHPAHRRDHGESVIRDHFCIAFAMSRVRVAVVDGRTDRRTAPAGAH
jgi:putative ATPase